jgi:hypothetical protein
MVTKPFKTSSHVTTLDAVQPTEDDSTTTITVKWPLEKPVTQPTRKPLASKSIELMDLEFKMVSSCIQSKKY